MRNRALFGVSFATKIVKTKNPYFYFFGQFDVEYFTCPAEMAHEGQKLPAQ